MEQKFSLSLSQLNTLIKDALFEAFPSTVWVVGEISELKENRNGHCYLELIEKEGAEITARTKATIWSYTYRMLKPYFESSTGQILTHGLKILVQVSIDFHSSFGLSLNIKDIDPTYTVGDLALQRKEIIERLKNEGVFDMNKELELPLVPQRIAVISSKTAAGYQDFINQLENNEHGFRFYHQLFEAYMQGTEAVPSIIGALERIFVYEDFFDVVVIIRGGGSVADLSCFDNYELALNITQFMLPVITGIGHEKDDTIIDMVAHTRMKTPTATAEFLISCVENFHEKLLLFEQKIVELTRETLDFQKNKLETYADTLYHSVSQFINDKNIRLIRKGNEFQQNIRRFSFKKRMELSNLIGLTEKKVRKYIQQEQERVRLNENTVRLLNPENVLKRGYTLTFKQGKIIKSVKDMNIDEIIETRFADGKIESKIIKK